MGEAEQTVKSQSLQVRKEGKWGNINMKHYSEIITIDSQNRFGKPCIRGLRISFYNVLSWYASGMSEAEILNDFLELNKKDLLAVLAYEADKEHRVKVA